MPGKRYADIYLRDTYTCQFCGNRAVTADHLLPVIAGGTNDPWNVVGACARCNRVKADMRLPNLITSFRILLAAGRTRSRGYPILLWQALLLGYPLEDVPWSHARSRWCTKAVADVLFNHPDHPRYAISKATAHKLLEQIRPYEPFSAEELTASLVRQSYIREDGESYLRGMGTPPAQQPTGIPPPPIPARVESAFGLVGEPRAWFTAKALKREIERHLSRLSPAPREARVQVWNFLIQKRQVFDCNPYFLVDSRASLRSYVITAWQEMATEGR
jgi:hypothetical protein